MINAMEFLEIMKTPENNNAFRLGKIDPAYSTGKPKIVFDGETSASVKVYSYMSSYTPVAGDRVLLGNVGGTYVVIGKIM